MTDEDFVWVVPSPSDSSDVEALAEALNVESASAIQAAFRLHLTKCRRSSGDRGEKQRPYMAGFAGVPFIVLAVALACAPQSAPITLVQGPRSLPAPPPILLLPAPSPKGPVLAIACLPVAGDSDSAWPSALSAGEIFHAALCVAALAIWLWMTFAAAPKPRAAGALATETPSAALSPSTSPPQDCAFETPAVVAQTAARTAHRPAAGKRPCAARRLEFAPATPRSSAPAGQPVMLPAEQTQRACSQWISTHGANGVICQRGVGRSVAVLRADMALYALGMRAAASRPDVELSRLLTTPEPMQAALTSWVVSQLGDAKARAGMIKLRGKGRDAATIATEVALVVAGARHQVGSSLPAA